MLAVELGGATRSSSRVSQALLDHYRCQEHLAEFRSLDHNGPPGYFQFGNGAVGYGTAPGAARSFTPNLPDLPANLKAELPELPFELDTAVDNLRHERYPIDHPLWAGKGVRRLYYALRPLIGSFRQHLQQEYFRDWRAIPFPRWPVDTSVEALLRNALKASMTMRGLQEIPFVWFWPDGARAAAMITHDVEGPSGVAGIPDLIGVDASFGLESSFQIVPEKRYPVPADLIAKILQQGCEVNVHDIDHDGRLFEDKGGFDLKAQRIRHYAEAFGARGFRSGAMYRNLEWIAELGFQYDMSVPNVAHLEPQHGGCCTVFPYFFGHTLELPLTLVQDYALFTILNTHSTELWVEQIQTILENHGLISLISHPDYVLEPARLSVYRKLLKYLTTIPSLWIAKPGEIDAWWRQRREMRVQAVAGRWIVEGQGSERARLGLARLKGEELVCSVVQ